MKIYSSKFPFFLQRESMDCGPTCLMMIAKYHGKKFNLPFLRKKSQIGKQGVNLKGISLAAESIGINSIGVKLPLFSKNGEPSLSEAQLPVILHWNQNHFTVLFKISRTHAWIADPGSGKYKLTIDEFSKSWVQDKEEGIALLLEPTPAFYNEEDQESSKGFAFLAPFLRPHKNLMFQLAIGLLLGSLFQLIFPFLTQSLVDIGIETHNISFIHLILIGQLMLFISQTSVRFIQSWIILHMSVRINISLISDFLIRLMKLPLGFFDSKHIGDLLQRIGDHKRIEMFLTQSLLTMLLSIFSLVIFGVVLYIYSQSIFLIFLFSSIAYILWIVLFLKKRKVVDYKAFQQFANNQDSLIEIIQGMAEIKLQGSEIKRRWRWTAIQAKLFRTQMKTLAISQYQDAGAMSISQLKDILITFIAAKAVVDGSISLGMMLAIQYIIGQLNTPLQQLIQFIRSAQDAKISLDRLSEIHNHPIEEKAKSDKILDIPEGDIAIQGLDFAYTKASDLVLKELNLNIPRGKTTAIVGSSGSGKTTLMKLLLGFYKPSQGRILIGGVPLNQIHTRSWRSFCGVVMQDGYLFSDTISNNISESDDSPILSKVISSATAANIMDFIHSLPLGLQTQIGSRGTGLSQGQRQRMLIARAIYKDPEFLFFDEATNALDANNEKVIMNSLNTFLQGKTALIIAHRLSTVRNADQIIVLEGGRIVELGTHDDLIKNKGNYYTLIKNQLALSS